MKKNVKVFVIKAHAANGNDRTVQAITPLNVTLADICKRKNIPMLSIVSTTVTAPMTEEEATCYVFVAMSLGTRLWFGPWMVAL